MTPEQRRLRSWMAAAIGHSRIESHDGEGSELPADERARRAEQARKAYFYRLALATSRARQH